MTYLYQIDKINKFPLASYLETITVAIKSITKDGRVLPSAPRSVQGFFDQLLSVSRMITVTFIRHGQSEDNVKNIWAGWKDSPLSEHANALGQSLASTRITHIYASPLQRAYTTAQYVQHYQRAPKPPLTTNPHLREQHFGIAEGHPWVLQQPEDVSVEELYEQKIFPVLYGREAKYPGAESLDELAQRTEIAIRECVLPHLQQQRSLHPEGAQMSVQEEGECGSGDGVHVAIASHGLCIAELISALLKLDPHAPTMSRFGGLSNTAWTRMNVRIREGHQGPFDLSNPPPLEVIVTHTKERDHLKSVNDIPHVELDAASVEARAFFGGESLSVPQSK
ncbi:2,3-bisphosphoglycerate-dependent phosphoglycerate mutase [Psilocybe cubensis]|uniref:2,3-bisphosphoglycerate-dependent phosphoglycerate mutase n=2 Tax=Psilocybe cubensis TaxID=181762 RepID=A0ACB8GS00_PSICU|nr:2,3-bisphosphoglycerate-dependent phosphoglycerate mutase [Psilocybe cubensis]KAH9478518.1 2,3-bisphosphoglycerate-dependent phosphoglycerate mutase [Psilocybe cubensis]